jgi:membrane protein implicated in regulation of membrane protease activity
MTVMNEYWFRQDHRWTRAYAVHWKGWVAGAAFVVAFFVLIAVFVFGLEALTPINYGLLVLLWLSILALMGGYHLFARPRTDQRWRTPETDKRTRQASSETR